ncbi:unnamed protein product [Cuscuta campestris]|uniref:Uncharacterized protein n=1 Tax=Cuscuta campestris TaxID=132261 RepID=A0A484LTT3_9ASTE|nr:unnamed protein product [Cuscuta campestris]
MANPNTKTLSYVFVFIVIMCLLLLSEARIINDKNNKPKIINCAIVGEHGGTGQQQHHLLSYLIKGFIPTEVIDKHPKRRCLRQSPGGPDPHHHRK